MSAIKTVLDLEQIHDKIRRFTDKYESGLEITEWVSSQIVKEILNGVFDDNPFGCIGDVVELLTKPGYKRENAIVLAYDLVNYVCEDVLECSGPAEAYNVYKDALVRVNDQDNSLIILLSRKRNAPSPVIRLSAEEHRELSRRH